MRRLWAAWLERRFIACGADSEEERVRRWLAPDTAPPPRLSRALSGLLTSVKRLEGPPPTFLEGAILIGLGRFEEAAAALCACAGRPSAELLVWNAEAKSAMGRCEDAQKDLARALELDPADTKALCLSALLSILAGDQLSAARLLSEAAVLGDAVAFGLEGFRAQRSGDMPGARRAIQKALDLRPRAAWPLALRALARRKAAAIETLWRPNAPSADLGDCLADLDRALGRRESAWILRLRAECREKAGHMEGAVADLDRALSLNGPNAFLYAQRGHCLLYRKRYEEAAADFSEAIRLRPGKAIFLGLRADAYRMLGRIQEAYEDTSACAALEPGNSQHGLRLARFEMLMGREEEALAKLARWAGAGDQPLAAEAKFLLAAREFQGGRYSEALSGFQQFDSLDDPGYRQLAQAFQFMGTSEDSMPETKKRNGALVIAGLGLHYPYQATLEVLKELSACDVVFSNLAGAKAMEFLNLFCRDVRTLSYEGGADVQAWVEKIFSALEPGKTAAFVTRGHPLISGHLAQRLIDRARRDGVEVRSYGAISGYDTVLALAGMATLETFWGLQAYHSRLVADGDVTVQTNLPLILEISDCADPREVDWAGRHIAELARALKAAYPPGHGLFLYGPRYESRSLESVAVEDLQGRLLSLEPEMITSVFVLVPPVRNLIPRFAVKPVPSGRACS